MSTQLIIDFESLGTMEDAVLLALGITAYSEKDHELPLNDVMKNNSAFWKFEVKEQVAMGRILDPDTLAWWKTQDAAAIDLIVKPAAHDISVRDLPALIDKFCLDHNYTGGGFVWQRGNMDMSWHDSLMADLEIAVNERALKWWKARDSRTAIDLLGKNGYKNGSIMKMKGMKDKFAEEFPDWIQHHPVSDIAADVFQFREIGLF